MILNKRIIEQTGICVRAYLMAISAGYIHGTDIEHTHLYQKLIDNGDDDAVSHLTELFSRHRYLFEEYNVTKFYIFDSKIGTHTPFDTLDEANTQRSNMLSNLLSELDYQFIIQEECEYADGTTQLKPRLDYSEYPQDIIDAHIESLKIP